MKTQTTKQEIEMKQNVEIAYWAINTAIRDAIDRTKLADIAGEPALGYDENEEPISGTAYDPIVKVLTEALERATKLKDHACDYQWNDDETIQRCIVCGVDSC